MKKLVIFALIVLLVGCSGLQISNEQNAQMLAYVAGKGMAIGIYKVSPKLAPPIEQAWMDMMGRCYNLTEIPTTEMLGFFNDAVIAQIPSLANDPYGLSGDLRFFLQLYGAEFNPAGNMIALKPIPMVVARAFQSGYEGGRSVAINMR